MGHTLNSRGIQPLQEQVTAFHNQPQGIRISGSREFSLHTSLAYSTLQQFMETTDYFSGMNTAHSQGFLAIKKAIADVSPLTHPHLNT